MEIKDFSELTQFIYDEYLKLTENFGVQKASADMIEFAEKSVKKYIKLYDKPLFRSEKRDIALREALETMPHGFVWKIFHPDLWKKIKAIKGLDNNARGNAEEKEKSKVEPTISVPVEIIKSTSLPQISSIEGED